jgi:hypothetical protein
VVAVNCEVPSLVVAVARSAPVAKVICLFCTGLPSAPMALAVRLAAPGARTTWAPPGGTGLKGDRGSLQYSEGEGGEMGVCVPFHGYMHACVCCPQ